MLRLSQLYELNGDDADTDVIMLLLFCYSLIIIINVKKLVYKRPFHTTKMAKIVKS